MPAHHSRREFLKRVVATGAGAYGLGRLARASDAAPTRAEGKPRSGAAGKETASMPARKGDRLPNLIFIFCDDLGYGDLGCYGHPKHKTPRLDKMAAEGVRFTDFYVTAPLCSPSRASLMTGCYPQRVGLGLGGRAAVLFPVDPLGLNPHEITVAGLLRARGYGTQIIGKWHLGDQPPFLPTRHGFDHFFGLPYSNDMGKEQRGRTNPPLPLMEDEKVVELEPDQSRLTERYTDVATDFIRKHRDQPFFLYLPHMCTHWPLSAPEEYARKSSNGVYGAEVELLDWSTGAILDTLNQLGIADNTLVIFTSDNGASRNGGGSNAPLRGYKGTTWEGGMREPFIAWWPGAIPAGSVCGELAATFDTLPTFARLAGTTPTSDRIIDGKDIWPLMSGASGAKSPHEAFFYYASDDLQAVRSGKWKLCLPRVIAKEALPEQLFNLEEDVAEERDVLSEHPDVAQRLRKLAEQCREDLGDGQRRGRNVRPAGSVEHPVPILAADADMKGQA